MDAKSALFVAVAALLVVAVKWGLGAALFVGVTLGLLGAAGYLLWYLGTHFEIAAPPLVKISQGSTACSHCNRINRASAKVCAGCGKTLGASGGPCPNCGVAVRKGAKFCQKCGNAQ